MTVFLFVPPCLSCNMLTRELSLVEQSVGRVTNLRVVDSIGNIIRIGWTGVAGATQYNIIILNTECENIIPF